MAHSLLIVDDDPRVRTSLSEALADEGVEVRTAEDGESALAAIAAAAPDVVITDVRMPGITGLELLGILKERQPETPVVLMTAFDDLGTVVQAMKDGAADFLVKPVDLHQLEGIIEKVLRDRAARAGTEPAPGTPDGPGPDLRLIGHHPKMIRVFKIIGQVAQTRTSVLIRGESGTGKELVARAIHDASPQAQAPFVAVNCTAVPRDLLESELFGHVRGAFTGAATDRRGRFALAGEGTIFLDEIGDTSPDFQSKLLRVLQEKEYYPVGGERPERTEARVLAATHRDLEAMVEQGAFREDLYYRLRLGPGSRSSVVIVPTSGGELREVFRRDAPERIAANFPGIVWAADSRTFLFATPEVERYGIPGRMWKADLSGAAPTVVELDGGGLRPGHDGDVAIHPDGNRIAFVVGEPTGEIWMMTNLPGTK